MIMSCFLVGERVRARSRVSLSLPSLANGQPEGAPCMPVGPCTNQAAQETHGTGKTHQQRVDALDALLRLLPQQLDDGVPLLHGCFVFVRRAARQLRRTGISSKKVAAISRSARSAWRSLAACFASVWRAMLCARVLWRVVQMPQCVAGVCIGGLWPLNNGEAVRGDGSFCAEQCCGRQLRFCASPPTSRPLAPCEGALAPASNLKRSIELLKAD